MSHEHVFRRKGDRLVNGVWYTAAELAFRAQRDAILAEPPTPTIEQEPRGRKRERDVMTAHDRRNWYRKMAGWPVRESNNG